MRKAITETEMRVYLNEQIAALDDLTRPTWKKFKVPLEPATCQREAAVPTTVFVVARSGPEVLLYDDVADEFGIGKADPDGVLRHWVTYGEEMRWTLRHFPGKARG